MNMGSKRSLEEDVSPNKAGRIEFDADDPKWVDNMEVFEDVVMKEVSQHVWFKCCHDLKYVQSIPPNRTSDMWKMYYEYEATLLKQWGVDVTKADTSAETAKNKDEEDVEDEEKDVASEDDEDSVDENDEEDDGNQDDESDDESEDESENESENESDNESENESDNESEDHESEEEYINTNTE